MRGCTLFQLNPESAYRLTVLISWLTLVGALYTAGRMLFGIAGGTLAAGLMLVATGSQEQGGWQAFVIGMWPMTLCCGLVLLALSLHAYTLEKECRRGILILLSFAVAGAILAHPFGFLVLMIALPLFGIASWILVEEKKNTWRRLGRNLLYIGLGIGLSGWWLFPFLASSSWTLPFGTPSASADYLSAEFTEARFLDNLSPLLNGIVVFSLLWGLFSKRMVMVAFALAGMMFLLLEQTTWRMWFYSAAFDSILGNIPLGRFTGMGKEIGFLLAGGMAQTWGENLGSSLCEVWRFLYGTRARKECFSPVQRILIPLCRCGIVIALLAFFLPVLFSFFTYFNRVYTQPENFSPAGYPYYPPYVKDFESAMQQIRSLDPPSSEASFFLPFSGPKVGVHTNVVESCIPYRYGYGLVSPFYMPTMLLTTRSIRDDTTAPFLAGMKYIIAVGGYTNKVASEPGTLRLNQFGEVSLFLQLHYSKNPIRIRGSSDGRASIEVQELGHLSIRLQGLAEPAWVRIGISRFRKWRAWLDGKEVPIVEHIEPDEPMDMGRFISVKTGNGLLDLRYAPQALDWFSYSGSWVCLVFLVAAFLNHRIFRVTEWDIPFVLPWNRWISTVWFQTGVSLLFCGILIFVAVLAFRSRLNLKTQFWFSSLMEDLIATTTLKSDGLLDFKFGLVIGNEHQGKVLKSVTLQEIYPKPLKSNNQWSTEGGPSWRVALFLAGQGQDFWNLLGPTSTIQSDSPRLVDVYAANPHLWNYFPSGTEIELTLHFQGGETASYRCPLRQQGRY